MTDDRIRVAHVISALDAGGAETALKRLLEHSDARRFAHSVVSLAPAGVIGAQIERLGWPVRSLGLARGRPSVGGVARLVSLLRAERPQVVQGWMYHGNLAATAAQPFLKGSPPLAWNVRGNTAALPYEKALTRAVIRSGRFLGRRAAVIVNNSRASAEAHARDAGYPGERTVVIPNGFDLDAFRFDEAARQRLRTQLGIPLDAAVVGVLGRYHVVKGHAVFLAAAPAIRRGIPGVHFVLAGEGTGESNQELAGARTSAGLAGSLHLLDYREDVAAVLSAIDLLCLPSLSEGFPNVVGEAMCCARPCVVTDVGDARMLLEQGGAVVPPGSAELLADAVVSMLRKAPAELQAIGARNRQRIEHEFSIERCVSRYEELYLGLVQRRLAGATTACP